MDDKLSRPGSCSPTQVRATLVACLKEVEGCVLCRLLARHVYDHVVRFGTTCLREGEHLPGLDPGTGLCNWHLWELDRNFDSPGFADKLFEILGLLPADLGLAGAGPAESLESLPLHRSQCWVCRELARDETAYVTALAGLLEENTFRTVYEQSGGLCLPHVHAVTTAAAAETRTWVLRAEQAHWERLRHDLAELRRKRCPQLREQVTRREDTSTRRCVQKLVGNAGRPWPSELQSPRRAAVSLHRASVEHGTRREHPS